MLSKLCWKSLRCTRRCNLGVVRTKHFSVNNPVFPNSAQSAADHSGAAAGALPGCRRELLAQPPCQLLHTELCPQHQQPPRRSQ